MLRANLLRIAFRRLTNREVLCVSIPGASVPSPHILRVPEPHAAPLRVAGGHWVDEAIHNDGKEQDQRALQSVLALHLPPPFFSLVGPDAHALEIRTPHYSPTPDGHADFSTDVLRRIARIHRDIETRHIHVRPETRTMMDHFAACVSLGSVSRQQMPEYHVKVMPTPCTMA